MRFNGLKIEDISRTTTTVSSSSVNVSIGEEEDVTVRRRAGGGNRSSLPPELVLDHHHHNSNRNSVSQSFQDLFGSVSRRMSPMAPPFLHSSNILTPRTSPSMPRQGFFVHPYLFQKKQ